MSDFDIVVAGGGMVGATLASLVSRAVPALRIAVVEGRQPEPMPAPDAGWSNRVSAVSGASRHILQAAGAWAAIPQSRLSPYWRMTVWDARGSPNGPSALHFDSADLGASELGHIVENRCIQAGLFGALAERSGVTWLCPCRVEAFDVEARRVVVVLAGRDTVTTQLLVGADGANSSVRSIAGIGLQQRDYHQHAVVATVSTEREHARTAWQRFLETGPLAFLPLADGSCSIVWSTTPEEAQRLLRISDEAFCAALTQAGDGVLGAITSVTGRASFPLRSLHARRYTSPRMALIGDAAHAVHPMAGQGVNLGFLDAAALAEVLADSIGAGADPGDSGPLRRYERWRKGENLAMAAAIDLLHRLFSSQATPLALLRSRGLGLVDQSALIKRIFMLRATGVGGDLPRRARENLGDMV
jgi:2-octaprenylphenol hydroxylase